jgi:hypothetical protein
VVGIGAGSADAAKEEEEEVVGGRKIGNKGKD